MNVPTQPMTDYEYHAAMDLVVAAGRLLISCPLDRLRDNLSQIEALAPILEPTAYQRGGGRNLDNQRRILDAAAKFSEAINALPEDSGGT